MCVCLTFPVVFFYSRRNWRTQLQLEMKHRPPHGTELCLGRPDNVWHENGPCQCNGVLYAAYNIKKTYPDKSFLILEKHNKNLIGGRVHTELFYGNEIVTGAGIGRKKKDKLLYKLLNELTIKTSDFGFKPFYSNMFQPISVKDTIDYLKDKFTRKIKFPLNSFKFFVLELNIFIVNY